MESHLPLRVSVPLLALLCLCTLPRVALGSDTGASGSEEALSSFQRRIERAEHLYESLEYEKALNWLSQAKQVASTIEEQAKVALYRGIVLADLGRRKQALEEFRAGLSLQPESALPLQVAPKVRRDFESVRKQVLRKLGTTASNSKRTGDADAEKPVEEPAAAPPQAEASVAEKPAAATTPAATPAPTRASTDLRSRLGAAGSEVGQRFGSALGSALDTVVGQPRKPAQTAQPEAPTAPAAPAQESTAKDEP
ncbi:tetratricopeptide repeat protein [Pyxidicoccus trucidator]|uniref:tetratricopeptide repeat protein n=1 Tax=Pyxidicoccus trucidator TaxID=2709662 RepID=UPI0013DA67E3|nr:tetratricopeptide repeat protein [Pyxidicoccus trucidator]